MQRAGLSRVSIVAFAPFHPTNTNVAAVVWTESSRAIFTSPIIFAETRIIDAFSVAGAIVRAVSD